MQDDLPWPARHQERKADSWRTVPCIPAGSCGGQKFFLRDFLAEGSGRPATAIVRPSTVRNCRKD